MDNFKYVTKIRKLFCANVRVMTVGMEGVNEFNIQEK
jgi:hypothetical protein